MKIYKNHPVNLLQSNFNMKGNISLLQSKIIDFWKKNKIKKNKLNKLFIIHDGPPFANGKIHLGHILNKILKDIILKFKNIINYKTPYILGWDCFGLPIENKFKKKLYKYKKIEKYNYLNKYINYTINNQKKEFFNLGIISDNNYIYKTIDYKSISEELRLIYNFNKKQFIYNNYKILYWCFECKNFLSKSEIYFFKKKDFSIIVIFLYVVFFFFFKKIYLKKKYLLGGILAWTTLPWTILANQGLCLNNEKFYVIINTIKGNFVINLQKYIFFKKKNKYKFYLNKIFTGKEILYAKFINPLFKLNKYFYKEININFYKKIKNTGTEILHISPNYGLDDYIIYKNNKYNNRKILDLFYMNGFFKFKNIFLKKNIKYIKYFIINYILKNNKYFNFEKYNHKYIFCKKDNNYIIYKNKKHLYINFKKKKKYIKDNLNKVKFLNNKSKIKFNKIIKSKPKWNISRQRFWGVYITNIINKYNKKNNFFKFFFNYYEIYGIKYWYKFNKNDAYNLISVFYKKLYEVLDVWFDSGTTHWNILRSSYKNILKFPSDLYLEGEDQYRGWFQSSFITSVLINKKIPFKKIINHGFVKTIYGEKFSKSLNNYVDHNYFINLIGIDLFRLLICNIKYENTIIFNKTLLSNTIDIYRKIRNCIRYFLINISILNYKKINKKKINFCLSINKYVLHYFNLRIKSILLSYNKYNFKKALLKIYFFLSDDLSSIYFNIIKNYLYLEIINFKKKNSIELILFFLLKNILLIIYPILPFSSEEAWNNIFFNKTISFEEIFLIKKNKKNINYWLIIKYFKNIFYKKIEILKKIFILSNSDINIYIYVNKKFFYILKKNINYLKNLLLIYNLKINLYKKKNILFLYKFIKKKKCIRCWNKKNFFYKKKICKNCYTKLYKQFIY